MAMIRGATKNFEMSKEQERDARQVVWTNCPKCGSIWVTKAVLIPGKCPVCGGKPKTQKVVM